MINYLLLIIAALMFSLQFFFQEKYQKICGTDIKTTLSFSLFSEAFIFICIFLINGFSFEFTPFSMAMCTLAALNGIMYTFCALKALRHINVSAYSMYAMLGGMLLPMVAGFLFYNEAITANKIVACLLILVSLFLTLDKTKNCGGGGKYYILVFLLNGLSGVLSKIHQSSSFKQVSSLGFLQLKSFIGIFLVLAVFLFIRCKIKIPPLKALVSVGIYSLLCGGGNLLLLVALLSVAASVQYPLVTGGVIAFSFIIVLFQKKRPTIREIMAAALAMVSVVIIVI